VTTGEEQLEPLVADLILADLRHVVLHGFLPVQQARLGGQDPLAADPVDGPVARCGDEPRRRVVRRPVARPALGGDDERLLGGVLGKLEVTEVADQGRQHPAPMPAKDTVQHGVRS
jgi:hypothetical protein